MPKKGQFSKFCKRGHRRNGRGICKECKPLLEARYWAKNKDKRNAKQRRFRKENPNYDRDYTRRIRKETLAHYGGKCFCCGEERYEFLGFDHVNGGGTKHRKEIGGGGTKLVLWLRRNGYPKGFRVACHNCNQSLGLYGYCPHKGDSE